MSVNTTSSFHTTKTAIDFVINQYFKDFDFIIIDDGCNNDIQNQIIMYATQHDDKIAYLRHKNRSPSESINRRILISNCSFITLIDSDGEYNPNHLSMRLHEIK